MRLPRQQCAIESGCEEKGCYSLVMKSSRGYKVHAHSICKLSTHAALGSEKATPGSHNFFKKRIISYLFLLIFLKKGVRISRHSHTKIYIMVTQRAYLANSALNFEKNCSTVYLCNGVYHEHSMSFGI